MWYGSSDVRDMKPSTRLNHLITKASLAKSSIGLGGKTRLISSNYRAFLPCHGPVPNLLSSTHSANSSPAGQSLDQGPSPSFGHSPNVGQAQTQTQSSPVSAESIHPTIMHDMRAFDGVLGSTIDTQFNLDFPSTSFTPSQLAPEFFTEFAFNVNDSILVSSTLAHQCDSAQGVNGLPVLDATWQSFVEQLGF